MRIPCRYGVGSPPLTWEKVAWLVPQIALLGITPTYVGKSIFRNGHILISKDHPHLRGKKWALDKLGIMNQGSPPLTWEKASVMLLICFSIGITPTYVGKRQNSSDFYIVDQDHPHLRGKKLLNSTTDRHFPGSPPLTWEKVLYKGLDFDGVRITPTYVGKSQKSAC